MQKELELPGDLGVNDVNYNEVLKKDSNKKRLTPYWSGQDVLQIGLNLDLAFWVIAKINAVRVWPQGAMGLAKKARVLLKMIVKHSLFDSAMTLAVLLNTIVMGMESHGIDPDTKAFTVTANEWFTWIFIVEMTMKLIAIGFKKYVSDSFN